MSWFAQYYWRFIQISHVSCYCFLSLFVFRGAVAEVPKTLVLVAGPTMDERLQDYSEAVLREALLRVNLGLIVVELPAKRAEHALKQESVDGLLPSLGSVDSMEPYLVRIPEPVFNYDVAVYSEPGAANVESLLGSQAQPAIVSYRRRLKEMAYRLLQPYGNLRLSPVAGARAGSSSIFSGRSSAYLDICFLADPVFEQWSSDTGALSQVEVLESVSAHGFLHAKHGNLAVTLSDQIKTMRSEGLTEVWFLDRFPHKH